MYDSSQNCRRHPHDLVWQPQAMIQQSPITAWCVVATIVSYQHILLIVWCTPVSQWLLDMVGCARNTCPQALHPLGCLQLLNTVGPHGGHTELRKPRNQVSWNIALQERATTENMTKVTKELDNCRLIFEGSCLVSTVQVVMANCFRKRLPIWPKKMAEGY